MALPTGTVTFLITDLEGSTRLWEDFPEAMAVALARHDAILAESLARHEGTVLSTMGDGLAAVFPSARAAIEAAIEVQLLLEAEPWGETGRLSARMGIHTAEGTLRSPDEYMNQPINRCARLMAIAHGGQVVVSAATAVVIADGMPERFTFADLGEHRLRDLADPVQVLQLCGPGLRSEFPPLRSLDEAPGNLPTQLTSFVGRDEEIGRVGELARSRALVTLTGVGGVGKTRLALQVAAEVSESFAHGAWLCELAGVGDPDAVWDTLAASLGMARNPSRPIDTSVLEHLGAKRLLIVLDNCEHLLDAVAQLVDAIARRCPNVAVLATSREGLALAGEHLVAVPALGVPAADASENDLAQSDAVRLFCDRARDVKPDFSLTEENAGAVVQVCRRLDGIPLAIELAAARARSLPPEDLVGRLDQRFRLLTRGSRAALERHQTLRNTIDWSYDLLAGTEQRALNRLSVFAGGCDLAAAEDLLAATDELDAIDVLSQLVDKSLVLVDHGPGGARYRLLETIRQYAQERLEDSGETATVRRGHADYYVLLAETAGLRLRSRDQLEWIPILVREAENFRAALDWAVEVASAEHALRLVSPLMVTGIPVGWTATRWADIAIRVPGAQEHSLYPSVVAFSAMGAAMHGELDRAEQLVAEAQAAQVMLGTGHLSVHAAAGTTAFFRSDLDEVNRHAEAWVDGARQGGEPYEVATALVLLSTSLPNDPERALAVSEEAIALARDSGIASAFLYAVMVRVLLPIEDPARVVALLDEAAEAGRRLGDREGVARLVGIRGAAAGRAGDWRTALRAFVDSVELALEFDEDIGYPALYWSVAFAFAALGAVEPAAIVLGYAAAKWATTLDEIGTELLVSTEELLRDGLGERRVKELAVHGASFDPPAAAAYMRAEAARVLEDRAHA